MGGQACVLYGGAEFSRDVDLAIATSRDNIKAIQGALRILQAEPVFFPPLSQEALQKGHACHFRCQAAGVENLRIDLMTRMRGCPSFEALWERRSIVHVPEIGEIHLLSLPDLIRAKKTQREKDWPMIRRLIETDIVNHMERADRAQIQFWFRECRTPALLAQLADRFPQIWKQEKQNRPLLRHALDVDTSIIELALEREQSEEKRLDREYWQPLKKELEKWRRERRR